MIVKKEMVALKHLGKDTSKVKLLKKPVGKSGWAVFHGPVLTKI